MSHQQLFLVKKRNHFFNFIMTSYTKYNIKTQKKRKTIKKQNANVQDYNY